MKKENMGKAGGTLPPRPNSKWANPFSSLLQPETLLFPRDDSTLDSAADEATATSGPTTSNNNNSGAFDTPGRSGNAQPPSTMMMMPAGGVSPSGDFDDLDIPSTSSRESTGVPPPITNNTALAAESADRYQQQQQQQHGHHNNNTQGVMVDQHLGPVDRLLLLVADGQSLSRRVLGNERQSARLGERLSALKNPLWQLQARVRTQAEQPPEFIHTLAEQVSHCLDVLLELTHPDWWNQIRRKVRRERSLEAGLYVAVWPTGVVSFIRMKLVPQV